MKISFWNFQLFLGFNKKFKFKKSWRLFAKISLCSNSKIKIEEKLRLSKLRKKKKRLRKLFLNWIWKKKSRKTRSCALILNTLVVVVVVYRCFVLYSFYNWLLSPKIFFKDMWSIRCDCIVLLKPHVNQATLI